MKRDTKKQIYDGSITSHLNTRDEVEKPDEEVKSYGPPHNAKANLQHWDHQLDRLLIQEHQSSSVRDDFELEHLQAFRRIDRAILLSKNVDDIGQIVLPLIPEVIFSTWIGLAAANFNLDEIHLIEAHPHDRISDPAWCGHLGWNWNRHVDPPGPVHSIRDLAAFHHASPFFTMLWQQGIQSLLMVPLIVDGVVWGFLTFGRDNPYRWSLDDIRLAREVAIPLAIGVQRTSEYTSLELKTSIQEYLVSRRAAEFKTSQALFQSMFENLHVGIALINEEGVIVDANRFLQNISGYGIDELRGNTIDSFLHTGPESEMQCRHKNGQLFFCRSTKLPIEQLDEVGFSIVTVEDLTEQKRNHTAILQLEKLSITGKLAVSLIHEINNPLQSAIGCLALTEEVMSEGGDVSKYLKVANEELERTARIVSQLRDLNQPTFLENKRQTKIQDLLEHTLMLVSKQFKDRNIRVTCHISGEDKSLPLVPDQIQQVFLNLVLNAIDAMGSGGELDIYSSHSPEGITISFVDTGTGISEDALQNIFEPLYSTKTNGLGLGLYISKSIIENLGGKLAVKSFPGKGTTFTIFLSLKDCEAASDRGTRK